MKWAIKFLLSILFRDDAGFYDLRREILNKAIEKDNRSKVTIIEKVYDPPYEFEVVIECERNIDNLYKLEFSSNTPYEVCKHTCECGATFNFTAIKSTKEMSWRDYGLTSKGSESLIGDIVYHNFKITKACEKAKDIKVSQNVESV